MSRPTPYFGNHRRLGRASNSAAFDPLEGGDGGIGAPQMIDQRGAGQAGAALVEGDVGAAGQQFGPQHRMARERTRGDGDFHGATSAKAAGSSSNPAISRSAPSAAGSMRA